MESDIAMIDFCSKCNWIWMDSDELEAITKMYVQFQKTKPHLDQKYGPKHTDIVGAHMNAYIAARAYMMSFVLG